MHLQLRIYDGAHLQAEQCRPNMPSAVANHLASQTFGMCPDILRIQTCELSIVMRQTCALPGHLVKESPTRVNTHLALLLRPPAQQLCGAITL
jgi:hypothetical protein